MIEPDLSLTCSAFARRLIYSVRWHHWTLDQPVIHSILKKESIFFDGDQTSILTMFFVAFTLLFCKTAEILISFGPVKYY